MRRIELKAITTFLVTVDRDCRKLFLAQRGRPGCREVLELEQRLDTALDHGLSPDARAWGRGLKTIRAIPGGYVVCDIFGIYELDHEFRIGRYVSIPRFTDLHSAFPYGDRLLVSNTGVDEVLWVNWEGEVLDAIRLHQWFPATSWMAHDLAEIRRSGASDLRLMPLDWARESCHVNWAEETPLGTMLSCFIQGEILFFRDGRPVRRVKASTKCHAPFFQEETQTILFAASEENRIVEIDLEGNELWSMEGFRFAKHVERLPDGRLIIADTGNRRIVEVDQSHSRIVWECDIPGNPYHVLPCDLPRGASREYAPREVSVGQS